MTFFDYPATAASDGGESRLAGPRPPGEDVFLADASESDWAALLRHCRRLRFEPGGVVIDPGADDRSLYLVVDGALEVLTPAPGRRGPRYRRAALAPPGSVLGEVSFFDGDVRSALVRAAGAAEVAELGPPDFEALAGEHPELSRRILFDLGRILARRLRAAQGAR